MLIYAPNRTAETYPYSIGQLRKDNPQVSFPKNPTDELLASYGVFPVTRVERPEYDRITHDLSEGTPEFVEGVWTQTWVLTAVSDKVVAYRTSEASERVRRDRDQHLQETDWIVARAYERGEPVSAEWVSYRQALRDVPSQEGFPWDVIWPTKPE